MKRLNVQLIFINFLAVCAALAVLAGFYIIFLFYRHVNNLPETDFGMQPDNLSIIGEFFGGTVGSIWALAGVILFYLALIYQRRELELQRQELKDTREILEGQSITIAIQQFENTFFQLLNFHLEASRKIQTQQSGNGFELIFNDFKKSVNGVKRKRKSDGSSSTLDDEVFENSFRTVYDSYKNTLSHYMESYKSLIYFIDEQSRNPEFYYNIIKPHLQEQEVLIQFYYFLFYKHDKKFISLAEKFSLLSKLNQRAVADIDKLHLGKLKPNAYK